MVLTRIYDIFCIKMENIDKELKKKCLTKDKTRKLTLMLNDSPVNLFREAAAENNIKVTKLIEAWIIKYLEDNKKI